MVIIDPKDLDDLWQKAGRVGRDRTQVKSPHVIVYIPVNKMSAALEFACPQSLPHLASMTSKKGTSRPKKRTSPSGNNDNSVPDIDPGLARVITLKCPPSAIDDEYNNPAEDPKCGPECTTCAQIVPILTPEKPCDCSGCIPERDVHSSTTTNPAVKKKILPLNLRVTKDMRPVGLTILKRFRQDLWLEADENTTGMLPLETYLPDSVMEKILDALPYLLSKTTLLAIQTIDNSFPPDACHTLLQPFITDNIFLAGAAPQLLKTILKIHECFDEIRQKKKEVGKAKRDAKKALSGKNVEPADEGSSDGVESEDSS